MKLSKEILEKYNPASMFQFKVKSKSQVGKYYVVSYLSDGSYGCECPGFRFSKGCKHIKFVKMHYGNKI